MKNSNYKIRSNGSDSITITGDDFTFHGDLPYIVDSITRRENPERFINSIVDINKIYIRGRKFDENDYGWDIWFWQSMVNSYVEITFRHKDYNGLRGTIHNPEEASERHIKDVINSLIRSVEYIKLYNENVDTFDLNDSAKDTELTEKLYLKVFEKMQDGTRFKQNKI